jgi:hypothetical protein
MTKLPMQKPRLAADGFGFFALPLSLELEIWDLDLFS